MDYFTTTSAAERRAGGCLIVGIYDSGKPGKAAAEIDAASDGLITRLYRRGDLSGKLGDSRVLNGVPGTRAERIVVTGLGDRKTFGIRQLRRATEAAAKTVKRARMSDLVSYLTLEPAGAAPYYLARHTAEAVGNAFYEFTRMKSEGGKTPPAVKRLGVAIESAADRSAAMAGTSHAAAIVRAANFARDLANLPANVCTPGYLARETQRIARSSDRLRVRVIDEAGMKRLRMGALLSVASGTEEPAKLIVMEYKGAGRQAPIVLVGKGITFDTGGLSLKPGPGMDEMKFDMCGAAAVIAAVEAAADLELPINIVALAPCCENLPSGKATRPGDIVRSMSGQTIEILNTDAEGRLILCDALTYARRYKPAALIDVATLTGACVIALGHHRSAIMSNDNALSEDLARAGEAADDPGWPLPLGEEYERQLESNFADFANVGSREGGAITAACFLNKFTRDLAWAHLDIAGTAWRSGTEKGATGRPVPMLTQFLLERAGALP